MSLLGSFFGRKPSGSGNPNPNRTTAHATPAAIRDTLFGDLPLEQWPAPGNEAEGPPWSEFAAAHAQLLAGDAKAAIAGWRRIADSAGLEPRHVLQAWHFLRQHGVNPAPGIAKQVLGVVIEYTMPDGTDLLAAYPDHSARYYNHAGGGVVWEHPDGSLDGLIDELLDAAREVVVLIGPWTNPRPPVPPLEQIRLSFLTPSGLHFGQAHFEVMSKDPKGARTVQAGTRLMQALIGKTAGKPG